MAQLISASGQNPPSETSGIHALVIGVSKYSHLHDGVTPTAKGIDSGLNQLTSPVFSAARFARWLIDQHHLPDKPLTSLTVLLSPSDHAQLAPLEDLLPTDTNFNATRNNVEQAVDAFIDLCSSNTSNTVIVYVAGHGVQMTKDGAILLLEDFAQSNNEPYRGALDLRSLYEHFRGPQFPTNQFWFADCCRERAPDEAEYDDIEGQKKYSSPRKGNPDSTFYLAAGPDGQAYGRTNGMSLFLEAFLWCVDNWGASVGPRNDDISYWHVSADHLGLKLKSRVDDLNTEYGLAQEVTPSAGRINEAVFHVYTDPAVDLTVCIAPQTAEATARWSLENSECQVLVPANGVWPGQHTVPPGLYKINVEDIDSNKRIAELRQLEPVSHLYNASLGS